MPNEQQDPYVTPSNEVDVPSVDAESNHGLETHEPVTNVAVAVRDDLGQSLQNSGEYTPQYLPPADLVPEKKLHELRSALHTLSSTNVVEADDMIAFLKAMKTARGIVGMIRGKLRNQQKHATQKTRSGKFKTVSTEAGQSSEETQTPLSLTISEAVRALQSNHYLGMYISTINGKTSLQVRNDISHEVIQVLRKVGQDLDLKVESGVNIEVPENFLVQYPHVAKKIEEQTKDIARRVVVERVLKEIWTDYQQRRYDKASTEIQKRNLPKEEFDAEYFKEFSNLRDEHEEFGRYLTAELIEKLAEPINAHKEHEELIEHLLEELIQEQEQEKNEEEIERVKSLLSSFIKELSLPIIIPKDQVQEEYNKRHTSTLEDFQKERAVFSLVDSKKDTLVKDAYISFLPPEASPDGSKPTKKNFLRFATDLTKEMIRQGAQQNGVSMVFEHAQFKGEKVYIVCPDASDMFKKGEAEFAFALNTLVHRVINSSPIGQQKASTITDYGFRFFTIVDDSDVGINHPKEIFQIHLKDSAVGVGLEADFSGSTRADSWSKEKFQETKLSIVGAQK